MAPFRRNIPAQTGDELAQETGVGSKGGRVASVISAVALVLSVYSLWESTLKPADLRVFVPPVIQYSAPYQSSNFEMVAIPVTLANEGAQTGTVLSMELAVTDPRTHETKRFYSADFGRWTMERTRSSAYQPFAPISLAGRTSRTESVLFYTRGEQEKPDQLIHDVGAYGFTLTLEEAIGADAGLFGWLWRRPPHTLTFARELRYYDARVFNSGTLPLYAKDWRSTSSDAPMR
jgi:hypothetical protein